MHYLGDSAYALNAWLIKIFPNYANLNADERYFNRRIQTIRNLIERTIAVLKMRFRILLDSERRLRYRETKAGLFVYACATLHNFLISNRFNVLQGINENELPNIQLDEIEVPNGRAGIARRNELVQLLHHQRMHNRDNI